MGTIDLAVHAAPPPVDPLHTPLPEGSTALLAKLLLVKTLELAAEGPASPPDHEHAADEPRADIQTGRHKAMAALVNTRTKRLTPGLNG
eukprot:CAMPEP_0175230028 /NCGR_PEP_ID=MMETSP0093-20121207/24734_1 /TAXON_ID=311494 /ORGANISM="Alexandrium monilatum, Strain CCMP3105" /LENGTH=88 /DNA_ID=CAMNT_0016523845 /DNA_START=246 /DNA_END=510 /DNA_ORIENTATION=-